MRQKLYIRSWLLVLFSILAITSKAQTVNISGYSSSGTESGYPLFNVAPCEITVSSTAGSFYYVYIDDKQFAYNSSSSWYSYILDTIQFADGFSHKLQLKYGTTNRGICYFKVVLDESNFKDGLYFSINGDKATVVAALSDIETAIIPETFIKDGISYPVTQIGNNAFYGKTNLSSVTIPSSILKIGIQAFNGCTALKEVTFSDSGNSVELGYNTYNSSGTGKGLFADCPIETLYVGRPYTITNYSSSYTYNSYPQRYGYSPFPSTISILTIGNDVTSIPTNFLYNGSQIESLTIPNSVTSIGSSAFYGCSGLTSVTIPQGVTNIGNSAFSGTGLTTMEFNAQNCTTCGSSSSPAFPSTVSSLMIGNNVTSIPAYFLYNGSQIESLTIPNSVTSIGYGAFWNSNSKLKSLTIGSGLLSIGDYAFPYTIPKVFWMGNTPPTGSNNIEASVNYVANDQYSLNNQLKYQFLSSKFNVDGTVYIPVSPSERTCDIVDCEYAQGYSEISLTDKVSNRGIEMSVLNINPYSFYNNDYITSLNISNNGEIGGYAFYDCDNLQTATIQNTGNIGARAFYNLKKLNSAILGDKVTGILSECFYGCSALTQFIIPDSVVEIGTSAFQNCSSIETVVIGSGVPALPTYVFAGCSSLSSLTLPNNIGSIGNYAFSGCTSLGDVTIEDAEQMEEKEPSAQSFPNWTSTNHSHSSTSYEEYTFNVNSGDVLTFNYTVSSEARYDYLIVKLDGSEIVKESGSKSGSYRKVFETSKNVTLYMAYTKDDSHSDGSDSASVTDIWLNGTSNNIDCLVLGSNGNNPLFYDCPLDEVYIGRKLSYQTSSSYGYSPFYRNTSLRTVEITDAETQIYDNEFYGCTNLSSLKIGNGVKTIGNWAFSGCSSLDYFSAGYMVESIGTEAFSDCTGLTKYYSYSIVPPVCGEQALDDINKWDCTLYVPDESSDEYQAAPQWKDFFFIEEMDAVLVAELSLNLEEVILAPTNTVQLTVQVFPTNATDKSLIWSSSNPEIANVNSDGLVTALADGTATIIVKSADGNSEATCIVTVDSEYNGVESIFNDSKWSNEVYNLNGYKVSDSTDNLAPGIYIVRQGAKTYKISVK